MNDLISREAAIEAVKIPDDGCNNPSERHGIIFARVEARRAIQSIPNVDAVPLDKLCGLLAEMYHCPASGWPASNHACHPGCPDEAFEKLCGTDCEKHTDEERWHAFLTKWMEEQDAVN